MARPTREPNLFESFVRPVMPRVQFANKPRVTSITAAVNDTTRTDTFRPPAGTVWRVLYVSVEWPGTDVGENLSSADLRSFIQLVTDDTAGTAITLACQPQLVTVNSGSANINIGSQGGTLLVDFNNYLQVQAQSVTNSHRVHITVIYEVYQ